MRTMHTREVAAMDTLAAHGVTITVERDNGGACPDWPRENKAPRSNGCAECGDTHGDAYRVTVTRGDDAYTFSFWGSRHDADKGVVLGPSDVVEVTLSDSMAEETADDVFAEFGPMLPSSCEKIAAHGRRLRQVIPAEAVDAAWLALND